MGIRSVGLMDGMGRILRLAYSDKQKRYRVDLEECEILEMTEDVVIGLDIEILNVKLQLFLFSSLFQQVWTIDLEKEHTLPLREYSRQYKRHSREYLHQCRLSRLGKVNC